MNPQSSLGRLLRNSELLTQRTTRQETGSGGGITTGEVYGMFLGLPGLVCFWPYSGVANSGAVYDVSGAGKTLTAHTGIGFTAYNNGMVPYCSYNGTTGFHSRATDNDLNVVGSSTLTFGGWFWTNTASPAGNQGLIGKFNDNGVSQRSYILYQAAGTATITLIVSADGIGTPSISHTTAITANAWHFIVGRWNASTELAIFKDGVKVTTAAGVPASVFSSTADFDVAAYANGSAGFLAGRVAPIFLSTLSLSDTLLAYLWQRSRALFGV